MALKEPRVTKFPEMVKAVATQVMREVRKLLGGTPASKTGPHVSEAGSKTFGPAAPRAQRCGHELEKLARQRRRGQNHFCRFRKHFPT